MNENDIIFYHDDMDRAAVNRKNELLKKFNYECADKKSGKKLYVNFSVMSVRIRASRRFCTAISAR